MPTNQLDINDIEAILIVEKNLTKTYNKEKLRISLKIRNRLLTLICTCTALDLIE